MDTKNVEIYEKLAKKYDLATSVVSFGIEKIWRKIFVKKIKKYISNGILLDVASATGDMAKEINFDKMYLLDPSEEMNKIAKEKLKNKNVEFIEDFAETFECTEKVDLIMAFMAVRNFDNLEKGIKNLDKCLKIGGYFGIVELTKIDSLFFKLSMFYMTKIVPLIGGIITGEFEAYKKFPKMIKNIRDEDILKNFSNYEIVEKQRLFPPMATLIIMRKNG
jgi:demethylmenaquinone methyltransferase/2-methoxy-6-polyprenyl-1,4-benzoquinol methylase